MYQQRYVLTRVLTKKHEVAMSMHTYMMAYVVVCDEVSPCDLLGVRRQVKYVVGSGSWNLSTSL